jgi:hypothetical protein
MSSFIVGQQVADPAIDPDLGGGLSFYNVNTNRVVMRDKALTGSANHKVKVVNLATSGRPRIDIDG